MYMPDLKPTYKERILSLTGRVFIEPGHVGAVYQDSHFSHFLKEGQHPPLSRWDQQLVAQIPIKPHLVKLEMEVQSADSFLFNLVTSISFTFNPMKADKRRQNEATTIALNSATGKLIQDQVLREAQYGARKTIGGYGAESLLCGRVRSDIEREIRHHLQATMSDLGVSINPSSGVLIESLTPPEVVIRVQNTHYERRKTIELLENHPETAIQTFLLESLTQQNGVMVFNNRNPMHILLENLYANAFDDSESHPLPADVYQTVNAAFTNKAVRANGSHKKEVIS